MAESPKSTFTMDLDLIHPGWDGDKTWQQANMQGLRQYQRRHPEEIGQSSERATAHLLGKFAVQ